MKIAIHQRNGSFSDRWEEYCLINKISYTTIDLFSNNILESLRNENITHLMWHYHHSSSKDLRVAPYILNCAERMGIHVFPNFETRWHFDDKIAQKYLLEAINAPLVTSYVFYDAVKAKEEIIKLELPIVFKLRRGAGSTNVKLLESKEEANRYIDTMFTSGFDPTGAALSNISQKIRIARKIKNPLTLLRKSIGFFRKNRNEQLQSEKEKGYFYFQKFLPNNNFDTRIIVVEDIAFGIRRFTRKGDFKASGSGLIDYDASAVDAHLVRIALDTTSKLKAQCLAYDFVYDDQGNPKIIEISFSFSMKAYDKCQGYWDNHLNFHKGLFNPQYMMIENLLNRR